MAEQNAHYVSIRDAVAQINAVRNQAANGSKVKPMTEASLKAQFGGRVVIKDVGSGKTTCIPRHEMEKLLAKERTAGYSPRNGFKVVSAPKREKKADNR